MTWADDTPALAGLAPETRARLGNLHPAEVPAGTVLFQPGDAVKGYVIVLQGRIGVHLVGPNGREILLYDVAPGQSCIQSTLGLLGGDDYSAEAVAETDARVVLLPKDDPWKVMFDALAEFPEDFKISREQPEMQEREPIE